MNAGGRKEKAALALCPVCGLDSGERVQDTAPPFLYRVRCTSCGAVTKGYGAKHGATLAWKHGNVTQNERSY